MSKKYEQIDESIDSAGMVVLAFGVVGVIALVAGVVLGLMFA